MDGQLSDEIILVSDREFILEEVEIFGSPVEDKGASIEIWSSKDNVDSKSCIVGWKGSRESQVLIDGYIHPRQEGNLFWMPVKEVGKEYLEKEIAKGNEQARLTKILFDAQKGVCALDRESHMIELAKGVSERAGKGVYPQDLEKDEFHAILIKMLKGGKRDEVEKILNQRSVVERNGEELVAIDYIDKFKEDFADLIREENVDLTETEDVVKEVEKLLVSVCFVFNFYN